jgi:hypothetical protein
MANTIASSLQQMSMSFGLACGSLIAGWYLGDLPQTAGVAVTAALHHAFLTLGGLTVLSWLSFWSLRRGLGRASAGGACVERSRACRPLATPAIHPISLF